MKITLSKKQWQFIGRKTGWMKISQRFREANTYNDKNNSGRTITLSGPSSIDPNFIYTATIRDEDGAIEHVMDGTLGEIYLWAKEVDFFMPTSIKELQELNI